MKKKATEYILMQNTKLEIVFWKLGMMKGLL